MLTIHGDEIRKLCISDMHLKYADTLDANKPVIKVFDGFIDYAAKSDAHYLVNYGDTISSDYLWYLHSLSNNPLAPNVCEKERKKYIDQLTRRRLRRDSADPDRFYSISHLIQQFAQASGHTQPPSKKEIEQKLEQIRAQDRHTIDFIIDRQNQIGKPSFILHGNHECITLSESEIAGIFNRVSGHKAIERTAHQYSFYKDIELVSSDRDPIEVREIFFNSNVHNHAKGGLVLAPYDFEWLKDTLNETNGHALINMHVPVNFDQTPKEDPYSITRTYKEAPRIRTMLGQSGNIGLVSAGHIHRILANKIKGVNYLTMPSFRHIPSFIDDEDRQGLSEPTGYFHELSFNFKTMSAEASRKRVILKKDGTTRIQNDKKQRNDFMPASPVKFDL